MELKDDNFEPLKDYNIIDDNELGIPLKQSKEYKCYKCGTYIGDIMEHVWFEFTHEDVDGRLISQPACPECSHCCTTEQYVWSEDQKDFVLKSV